MDENLLKTIGERIRHYRNIAKITQKELADKCGTSQGYIADIERGKLSPSLSRLNDIARVLNVKPNILFKKDNGENNSTDIELTEIISQFSFPLNPFTKIPVLGVIRAGEPVVAEQNIIGYVELPADLAKDSREYFGLRVLGDSMNLDRICEGDVVIVKKQDIVENGDIAVVLVDDENATIKRFYQTDTTVTLVPHSSNPIYKPRVIDPAKISVKVLGKVVRAIINF